MEEMEEQEPRPDTRVGERVKSLRENAQISQDQVAIEMRNAGFKWSNRTVWQVETGSRPLRLIEAEALIAVLRTPELRSVDQLLQTPTAEHLASAQRQLHRATSSLNRALIHAFDAYRKVESELGRAGSATHDLDSRTRRLIARVSAKVHAHHPLRITQKWIAYEALENSRIDESLPQELGELLERHRSSLTALDQEEKIERKRKLDKDLEDLRNATEE